MKKYQLSSDRVAVYNSIQSYVKALTTGQTGSGRVAKTEAEARAKIAKWQGIVEQKLRQHMRGEGYKSGGNVIYGRTGEYPTHTGHSGVSVSGDMAEGTVYYTPYVVQGLYGSGSVDIVQALEHGYQVGTQAWYLNRKNEWKFDFRGIPYFGYRPATNIMSKVVSSLQGMCAADGVKISLG